MPPSRDWLEQARAALDSADPALFLVAPAGPDRADALRRVADGILDPVHVDCARAQDAWDIHRLVGHALDLPVPGDAPAAAVLLTRVELLVLADAPGDAALEAADALRSMAPELLVLVGCDAAPDGQVHLDVPGARGGRPLPDLAPVDLDRLLGLSEGGPVQHADPDQVLALRRSLRDEPPGPYLERIAAALARVLATQGQLPLAREVLEASREVLSQAGHPHAFLDWAEGDLLLDRGLIAPATGLHERALHVLRRERPDLACVLLQRTADVLTTLGERRAAAARFVAARKLARSLGDDLAVAAALRGSGDLATAGGETLSAEALYEQAGQLHGESGQGPEHANLLLGQAALALTRGESGRAGSLLTQAEDASAEWPVLQASVARRRADLALRRGLHESAEQAVARALEGFRSTGQLAATARCLRLLGDIQAARGRLLAASECYQAAVEESARIGDLRGARRTLEHLLVLERAGADTARVEDLLRNLSALDAELGSPSRQDLLQLDA